MISRRKLILGSCFSAVAGSIPVGALATKTKVEWRCTLAVPKTLAIWGPGLERFSQMVELLTGGQFKIQIFGAGELIPALGTFEAVMNGEVQAGSAAAYYWLGKVPAAAYFTSVPFGMPINGLLAWLEHGGGQELYDQLMHPYGVTCMPCGATGFQMAGWFKNEINTIEDLKGLKIRIPGIAGRVLSQVGAVPVLMPGGEIFTSLSTGVIDAVEWVGPYHDYLLGLHRAAKYYYGPGWQEPGPALELMINLKAWQELPKQYQLAIKIAAAETTRWMLGAFESKNSEYLVKFKSMESVQLKKLSPTILDRLRGVSKDVMSDLANSAPIATKIHRSYTSFQKNLESFWTLSGDLAK